MKIHAIPLGIDNCYLLEGEKCVSIDGGALPRLGGRGRAKYALLPLFPNR
jgi:hypothetical protein